MDPTLALPVGDTDAVDYYYFYQDQDQPLDLASPTHDYYHDGATDTAPSPVSPMLPEANTYQLPNGSAYPTSGAKEAQSPSRDPSAIHAQYTEPMSPAVHSFELAMAINPNAIFDPEHFQDFGPMFDGTESVPYQPPAKSRKTSGTGAAPTMGCYDTPPSTTSDEPQYPSRKRKSVASAPASAISSPNELAVPSPQAATRPSSSMGGVKKTAHNMIEKRYRTNLNDRINTLRDSVPALRIAQYRLEQGHSPETPMEDLDEETLAALGGLELPPKLNKATILAKAAEYITHLERQNQQLKSEIAAVKNRMSKRRWN